MTALLPLYSDLAAALTADPCLLLACAVAAFDPIWQPPDEDADPLMQALGVTRTAFPDLYADAIVAYGRGDSTTVERLICRGVTERGIPVDDIEALPWGIPLTAHGIELSDPEFYEVHADLLPLLALFGLSEDADPPDDFYRVISKLVASLTSQTDPTLRQVGWGLAWIGSCSGNSIVDLSPEEMGELQPLAWTPEDVAFALELIAEADALLSDAAAGLTALSSSPDLLTALEHNLLYVRQHPKGTAHDRAPRLDWPGAGVSTDRAAAADAEFLHLWRNAA